MSSVYSTWGGGGGGGGGASVLRPLPDGAKVEKPLSRRVRGLGANYVRLSGIASHSPRLLALAIFVVALGASISGAIMMIVLLVFLRLLVVISISEVLVGSP